MWGKDSAHWATSLCLLFILGIFYNTVTFWTNSTAIIIWTFMLIPLPWSPQSVPPVTFWLRFLSVSSGSWVRSYQGRLCGWWGPCWALHISASYTASLVKPSWMVGRVRITAIPLRSSGFCVVVKVYLTSLSLQSTLILLPWWFFDWFLILKFLICILKNLRQSLVIDSTWLLKSTPCVAPEDTILSFFL